MNKTIIIGNLTRDPEYRNVGKDALPCCTFTVAVNKRVKNSDHPQADYFRVTAWRQLADLCASYLAKGRKVCIEGRVGAQAYVDNKGEMRCSLELQAESVEFLTPKGEQPGSTDVPEDAAGGFTEVDDDELPF